MGGRGFPAVVENVLSMDAEARRAISWHLGVEPIALCPSDDMPYNRPRLAYGAPSRRGVRFEQMVGFVRVHPTAVAHLHEGDSSPKAAPSAGRHSPL